MYLLDQMHGMKGIRLTRAGGAAALVYTAYGSFFAQEDGDAGESLLVVSVTDTQTENGSDRDRVTHKRWIVRRICVPLSFNYIRKIATTA
jgi:hypothetical protein